MKNFFKSCSLILIIGFAACNNPYRHLHFRKTEGDPAMKYQPRYDKELYRCKVDGKFLFKKFHVSGNLFFKRTDSATRVIFQNEMGFSIFDFKWDSHDSFKVVSMVQQMNKPVVIKILQTDLSLLLMKNLDLSSEAAAGSGADSVYRFRLQKGYAYYNINTYTLRKIDNTGRHKVVTTITLSGIPPYGPMPDSVLFVHHRAHFTIQLYKLPAHVKE